MRDFLGNFNVSSNLEFARGIQLLDDCEGTCNWVASGTGADFGVTYDTAAAFIGTKGLYLITKATTPAADDQVTAERLISAPESELVVIRAKVCMPDVSDVSYAVFGYSLYKATGQLVCKFKYDRVNKTLSYWNSAGAYVEIAGYDWTASDKYWMELEAVLDVGIDQYESVALNGIRTVLGVAGQLAANASGYRGGDLSLQVVAVGANRAELYADGIYVGNFLDV